MCNLNIFTLHASCLSGGERMNWAWLFNHFSRFEWLTNFGLI